MNAWNSEIIQAGYTKFKEFIFGICFAIEILKFKLLSFESS